MIQKFLITGMFRSGTTMIARMLHSNPEIVCASDPFAPIFKSFRNAVRNQISDNFDPEEPLQSYYFSHEERRIYEELQQQDFALEVSSDELLALRKRVRDQVLRFSETLAPYIAGLSGATYSELFDSGIGIIERAYPKSGAKAIGFKEVWVGEFGPHFRKLWPSTKVVHVIRDPRAVIASNFASKNRYPILFLIRQWRKLATLALKDSMTSKASTVVRFEDILTDPKSETRKLSLFLGASHHSNMLDPQTFKDGKGESWLQNSTFDHSAKQSNVRQSYNLASLERWRSVLKKNEVTIVELLCQMEMNLLGYSASIDRQKEMRDLSFLAYMDDSRYFAGWIKPYSKYDNLKEFCAELERLRIIYSSNTIDSLVARQLLIEPEVFRTSSRLRPVLDL